ncbi:MAG TPA: polysaccharide ABC transporter ATP-binding protein [Hanamia sp.]|nr:polysaccharide ABC transporter ATP-binding protein [Hanamia sp.]
MSNTVIKVENLSKQYRLGNVGTGSLVHDMNRAWHRIRGKEDPYLKIGEENDRSVKGNSEYVWALRDINFEVKQGEVLGIIGRNGAGKSTLLKILSRTTTPTTGQVKIKGRVASLLEVGTGFHGELTGRENIFLNGAILGMTKKEIKSKLDEIIDFSGVERYIDTPVKRYSSGMYVRLAFGVAAHLEPEILIVDEVLAVGDAEFQKKAIGKMKDISQGQGRTVLFVSHNLNSVAVLCDKGLLLNNGIISVVGEIENVLTEYNSYSKKDALKNILILSENKKVWLTYFSMVESNSNSDIIETFMPLTIKLGFESLVDMDKVNVGVGFNDSDNTRVFTVFSKLYLKEYNIKKGYNEINCLIDSIALKPGNYFVEIYIGTDKEQLDYYDSGLQIEIKIPRNTNIYFPSSTQGHICVNQQWF